MIDSLRKRKKMGKLKDITGQKFGEWVAIRRSGYMQCTSAKVTMWLCQCSCGFKTKIALSNLTTGKTKRCTGCSYVKVAVQNRRGDIWDSAFRRKILNIAKHKGHDVKIDEKDYKRLASGNCHYCDEVPSRKYSYKGKKTSQQEFIMVNGIDRKNPKLGYTKSNSVSCCTTCNLLKNKMGYKEFLEKITKIYTNIKKEVL